jgi:hypothetical protein
MMKRLFRRRASFGVIFVLILIGIFNNPVRAEPYSPRSLPADLVFTGRSLIRGTPTIALIDAVTLEVRPLYSDETASDLRVMSWSPQGDAMAVLRIDQNPNERGAFSASICILTITGTLHTCLDERLPDYYEVVPMLIDYNYTVTWSAAGERVYFLAESADRQTRRLVEASVRTGKTFRTIYEVPAFDEEFIPSFFVWTSDLNYIAAGTGYYLSSGMFINLKTLEQQSFSELVTSWPSSTLENNVFCTNFSPKGTYLTAVNIEVAQLTIFDTNLHVRHVVENFDTEDPQRTVIYCPTWIENETGIYLPVRDLSQDITTVFHYSLETRQLSEIVQGTIYPPLVFSPEKTHMAYRFPNVYASPIRIIYPDGEIRLFGRPFMHCNYPPWRPRP